MEVTILRERRDPVDGQPQELEVLLHNFYGDKVLLQFDMLGTVNVKLIGHRENNIMQFTPSVLKSLNEISGAWLADIERFEVEQRAKLEAERKAVVGCTADHGAIEYQESCPVCGWTNEIPF